MNWPLRLTVLRLALLPVFLYLLLADVPLDPHVAHPRRWLAIGIFAVMAITDWLDGYLARRLNQTTQLGTWLDPMADKLLIAASSICLAFPAVAGRPYAIPWLVVFGMYFKDIAVIVGASIVTYRFGKPSVKSRFPGKVSTVLELALVLATLLASELTRLGVPMLTVLPTLWTLMCLGAAWAGWDYFEVGVWITRRHRVAGDSSAAPGSAGRQVPPE